MSAKPSSSVLPNEFSKASCLRAFFLEDFPDGVDLETRPLETTEVGKYQHRAFCESGRLELETYRPEHQQAFSESSACSGSCESK